MLERDKDGMDDGAANRPGDAGARLVAEFYALAAEPTDWSRFLEAMEQPGEASPDRQVQLGDMIAGGERVAAAHAATPISAPRVAVVVLAKDGRRRSANAVADSSALAALGRGEAADDRATARHLVTDAQIRLAAAGGQPVIVNLSEAHGSAAFGYAAPLDRLPPDLAAGLSPPVSEGLAIVAPMSDAGEPFWLGFSRAFGLTAAELRLVDLLHGGLSLTEAAEELGLSVHTVRNQLRPIFAKTGINRQSDLTRALAELATLPMAAPGATASESSGYDRPDIRFWRMPDGRRMAYRAYGREGGRPVMLFHAGVGASLAPSGTDQACRELGLWLVAPERPGIGRSDPRPEHSLDGVADDLAAFAEAQGLEAGVTLVSFTSGARFALATADRMGRAVERILMLSPRPPQPAGATAASASPMVRFQRRIVSHPWLSDALFAVIRLRLTRRMVEKIMRASALGRGDTAYIDAHADAIDNMYEGAREAFRLTARGTADELRAASTLVRQTSNAPPPVTVWQGEEDTYVAAAEVEAWLGGQLAELRRVPDIGNYLIRKHWRDALAWASR